MPQIDFNEIHHPSLIVDDSIDIISREIDLLSSYDRTVDSILTLQDLASIHNVEDSIKRLTIILVIFTIILVVLELWTKLGLLQGGN